MTVYIEYALIDNFIIDYLLLKCSFIIVGIKTTKLRIIISAVFGTVFAVLLPLFIVNTFICSLLKVNCSLIMILLSAKFKGIREYVFAHFIFLILTFVCGGFITAVFNLFGINKTDVSIGLIILPIMVFLKITEFTVKKLYKRRYVFNYVYDVIINVNGISVKCKGFLDSGNCLYDNGIPVIVCSENFYRKYFKVFSEKKDIAVYTVNGVEKKFATKCKVKIYLENQWNIFNNITLCITDKGLNSAYDVILHPALFKERGYECFGKNKKVS